MLGYPCEDLEGTNLFLLDHPSDAEVYKEYDREKKTLIHELCMCMLEVVQSGYCCVQVCVVAF